MCRQESCWQRSWKPGAIRGTPLPPERGEAGVPGTPRWDGTAKGRERRALRLHCSPSSVASRWWSRLWECPWAQKAASLAPLRGRVAVAGEGGSCFWLFERASLARVLSLEGGDAQPASAGWVAARTEQRGSRPDAASWGDGPCYKTGGLHVLLVCLVFWKGEDVSYHIWLCNLQLLINLKFQCRFL